MTFSVVLKNADLYFGSCFLLTLTLRRLATDFTNEKAKLNELNVAVLSEKQKQKPSVVEMTHTIHK